MKRSTIRCDSLLMSHDTRPYLALGIVGRSSSLPRQLAKPPNKEYTMNLQRILHRNMKWRRRLLNFIVFIMTWSSIIYKCCNHKRYNMELPKHIPHHALWTHKPVKINPLSCTHMMMSWHGNIFCVTCPLWGESTGHLWIPSQRASNTDFGVLWYQHILLNKKSLCQ